MVLAVLYLQSLQHAVYTCHELNSRLTASLKMLWGNKVESADKRVESVLQGADLCHIIAAVLAGWGCTVAAVYTIALFDQNP